MRSRFRLTYMNSQQNFTPEYLIATGPQVTVPNEFPKLHSSRKLAIVGTAPGVTECSAGKPFTGPMGNLLYSLLRSAGITRDECFLGNISQTMPPGELTMEWSGVAPGIEQLKTDLQIVQPYAILLLGDIPLQVFDAKNPRKASDWRGSILRCDDPSSPFNGYKCIPTIHPSNVFKNWEYYYLVMLDVRRAVTESTSAAIDIPQQDVQVIMDPVQACHRLELITNIDHPIAMDIEGGVTTVSCVSFALSPSYVFVVPLETYSLEDRARALRAISRFCVSSTPKILQNSLYDNFVLSWAYKIPIKNVLHDTMLSSWEIYPELPKSLAVQTSIWTRQPFYKFERKSDRRETFYNYCGKDSAVTAEIHHKHIEALASHESAKEHYKFNVDMLKPSLYMELRGLRFDQTAANDTLNVYRKELVDSLNEFNQQLDILLPGFVNSVKLSKKQIELNMMMGDMAPRQLVNLSSPKQVSNLLYTQLGIPKRFKREQGRLTDEVTTGVDALLDLLTVTDGPQKRILELLLQYRRVEKLCQTLSKRTDSDGRMRAGYNVVGSETGRFTCYESPTGNGDNLQTITKSLRRLFRADPDMWLFQCDLSGADGWTVAAHCSRLGDSTMMEDYLAGIKPAKVIALMYMHGTQVNSWSRAHILEAGTHINDDGPDGWLYFASKRVQHGTNYMLGKNTMAVQIMKDSYKLKGKPIYLSPTDCVRLQALYTTRYPGVRRWQQWVQDEIRAHSKLSCASGHIRKFFGRRDSNETYRAACSHEPQANTTFATNKAMLNLWKDPDNRRKNGSLKIEPLHQVHDAVIGQFRKEDAEWATKKIRSYFNNTLIIAGQPIIIPFEGAFGPSWGELGPKYGGGHI